MNNQSLNKYYQTSLEFLSSVSAHFLGAMSYENLFNFIGEQLYLLSDKSLVVINEYDEINNRTIVRAFHAQTRDKKIFEKILGKKLVGFSLDFKKNINKQWRPGELKKISGGIYELSFRQIPQTTCRQLEKELNLGEIYVMRFIWEDNFLGTVIILTKKDKPLTNQKLIEIFINQAAVALKHKKAEGLLRESEQLFRTIFDNAATGITLSDMQGHPLEVNSTFQKMIGFSKEELRKMFFVDFTHPNDIALDLDLFKKMKKGKCDSFNLEKRYFAKDGRTVWVDLNVSLIRDLHKKPKFTIGIIKDISKRKETEDRLKLYSKVVEEAPDGVQIIDLNGRIIYSNKATEQIFGFSPREFQKKNISEINIEPEYVLDVILPQIKEKGYWSGELTAKHKNKRFFPVGLHASLVKDDQDNPIAIVAVSRDITENKKAEHRKNEFISIASHELKTPLTSIKIFIQILTDMFIQKKDKEAIKYLGRMNEQLNKLIHLVSDLLDVSKIQSGKLELRKNAFSLPELIKETVENFQATTQTHKIIIQGTLKKRVFADKERISQVLINLFSNAIKYSPKKDRVIVKIDEDKDFVTVSVQDFGIGIPEKHQKNIFDPFYRINETRYSAFPGLGMGLHISMDIIKYHGGNMWVHSQINKGSTFYFILPLNPKK